MDVIEIFKQLVEKTTPSDQESAFLSKLIKIIGRDDYKFDSFGNLYYVIGEPETLFVCHVDDVSKEILDVNIVKNGNFIESDKSTILGADNKAGVALLVSMMHYCIPGTYCFFKCEEVGCIGSEAFKSENYEFVSKHKRCVAFDRRGYNDIVTDQNNINCASLSFATELSNRLNKFGFEYSPSTRGSMTDSGEFKYLVSECVNISIGYFDAHSKSEKQDVSFLKRLSETVRLIDWSIDSTREIPNLQEIAHLEITAYEYRERYLEEIELIEKELGFSLY